MLFDSGNRSHILKTLSQVIIDALIFAIAFIIGTWIRFSPYEGAMPGQLSQYAGGILLGAFAFVCAAYICGLYAERDRVQGAGHRFVIILLCYGAAFGLMLAMFYFDFSSRIGRGVMAISSPIALVGLLSHHFYRLHRLKYARERVAYLIGSDEDLDGLRYLRNLDRHSFTFIGVIVHPDYQDDPLLANERILGESGNVFHVAKHYGIERLVCGKDSLAKPELFKQICELRYSGIQVLPLAVMIEELEHRVPVGLVNMDWLLNASGTPHAFYIRKVKRLFDIMTSLIGLGLLWPVVLLSAGVIKLSSPGPIFYLQTRSGRFGKPFQVIKLRSMHTDAEKHGPQWTASKRDRRMFAYGAFMRKYRIDEIPQMINVLRGEMSFVGPRPERPEFEEDLAAAIPYYKERQMLQPGITGWAQVNYPYGASIDDAARKLEYDVYYMKYMSLFLDVFILADTVRIVLTGGLDPKEDAKPPRPEDAVSANTAEKNKVDNAPAKSA